MSLKQLFNDPLMLFKALFGFLWTEDIVNVRLVCKGFNDVAEIFKETLKKDVGYRNLIEDYEGYYEKVKKAYESRRDCRFAWNWINISMKWDVFKKALISLKGDFKISEEYHGISIMGLRDEIQDGNHITWHPDGKKRFKCFYKDGKRDGKFISWHKNGQKCCECFYKNGNMDGKSISWYQNGRKSEEYFYKDDKQDGEYIGWWDNGQKRCECFYKNGELDGKYIRWYKTGKKFCECFYKNDNMDGEFISWCENGKLEKKCSYKNGIIVKIKDPKK